jgi:hypothetical protein
LTGGFGAVPDELLRTANKITDAVGRAGSMLWQGPSGDYGNPGVQQGWGTFVEDLKAEIEKLCQKAYGHGDDLRAAATSYTESDSEADAAFGQVGGLLDSGGGTPALTGAPGGGFTGGLSSIMDRLGGAPSGGDGQAGGIMSPQRSQQLFPGQAGGDGQPANPGGGAQF